MRRHNESAFLFATAASLVLGVAASSEATPVNVHYDPGNFGIIGGSGQFVRINGTSYSQNIFSEQDLSLEPGTYNVIVSSANVGDFTVAADGSVTSSAAGLTGGANQVSLNTVQVDVSISSLWQSNWTIDWAGSAFGDKTTFLPIANNYSSWYGRQGISQFNFDVSAAGAVSVHNISPAGETITGGANALNFPVDINAITVTTPNPAPPGSTWWQLDTPGFPRQPYSASPYTVNLYGGSYNFMVENTPGFYFSNALNIPGDAGPGWSTSITVNGSNSQPYTFFFAIPALPEPSTLGLLGVGAVLMARRRKLS